MSDARKEFETFIDYLVASQDITFMPVKILEDEESNKTLLELTSAEVSLVWRYCTHFIIEKWNQIGDETIEEYERNSGTEGDLDSMNSPSSKKH